VRCEDTDADTVRAKLTTGEVAPVDRNGRVDREHGGGAI
jgi:hypothetical protein